MSESLNLLLKSCEFERTSKKIVSIDVGIINMGIISCWTNGREISEIETCELVNIKELSDNCCNASCKLCHEANVIDWVSHFIAKFSIQLQTCEKILIEKQPPGGLQHVETLLIKEYRNKVISIYPVSLHKYMDVSGLEYEERKKKMEKVAKYYLDGQKDWETLERKHDMADALCFIKYYLETADYSAFPLPLLGNAEPIESFRYHK